MPESLSPLFAINVVLLWGGCFLNIFLELFYAFANIYIYINPSSFSVFTQKIA